jgi:acyl-CoA dehydrogenase
MEAAGPHAWPYAPEWLETGAALPASGPEWAAPATASYFDMRKISIYGGTNEVQRGIIARMILNT